MLLFSDPPNFVVTHRSQEAHFCESCVVILIGQTQIPMFLLLEPKHQLRVSLSGAFAALVLDQIAFPMLVDTEKYNIPINRLKLIRFVENVQIKRWSVGNDSDQ
jgi:hypothetical protein